MNCDLPILTDSGGFQVMSLSKLNKIDPEKGAIFNSHIDGKKFYLSPEESIRIQLGLNSDIVMVMDECPKKSDNYELIKKSMNLSLYWAERSKRLSELILTKHYLVSYKVVYLKILELSP